MKRQNLLLLVWLMAITFLAGKAVAQVWGSSIILEEAPPTGGTVNYNSRLSMVVVNGNPAIATDDGKVIFSRATDASGTNWTGIVVADNAQNTSLSVVNGNPAISYMDQTNQDLKYVRANNANGTSWGTPVTIVSSGAVGWFSCLQTVKGYPAIAYFDATNQEVRYVLASDSAGINWGTPVTAAYVGSSSISLAVVNGHPAIGFYDHLNTNLVYVRASDSSGLSWGSPVVLDSVGSVGIHPSLNIVDGKPAISYQHQTNADLKYIRATDASGNTWDAPVVVVSSGSVGSSSSLEVVNGTPAISYFNGTTSRVNYVKAINATGSSWGSPVQADQLSDLTGFVSTSMCIVNGYPAVAVHSGSGRPRFSRASDVDGTTWNSGLYIAIPGTTGLYSSICIANGYPAIAYYDNANKDLRYICATDSQGKSWNNAVLIDSVNDVGSFLCLIIVDGNPAISYYDGTNGDLKYVRAADASGSSWGTPQTIDATGYVGHYTSLAIVDGNPAISYYDNLNGDLKYVRATDASGNSWGSPQIIDAAGYTGQYTSLAMVNGHPAISYYHSSTSDLKYVRATDASGNSWGSPQTIDAGGQTGQYTSLKVVNGNPAIAYYYSTSSSLRYVRATDVNGSTWGTPVTVASGKSGRFANLAVIDSYPAIAYNHATTLNGGNLRYVRASDTSGSSWGAPVDLETGDLGGKYGSLAINGNHVFIAYQNSMPGTLQFISGTTYLWTGGSNTTDWYTAGNWSNSTVPLTTSNIGIPGGLSFYPDVTTGTANTKDLTMASGASLIISGGVLQLTGNLNNNASITGAGKLVLNGSQMQTISGTGSISNLELNNSAGATISGDAKLSITNTFTPTVGVLTTNGNLVLKSDATTTARIASGSSSGGYISGAVTAERYIPGKRAFRFLAHPFTASIALSQLIDDIDITGPGGANNGFTPTQNNNPSAFWFDVAAADTSTTGANPGWARFTNTNGTGSNSWDRYELMRILVRGGIGEGLTGGNYTPSATTLDMSGTVNQGTQVITLTKGANTNFAACGNPFPSAVQMNAVARGSNVGANYYAWDATSGVAGAYVTNAWTLSYRMPAYGAFFTTVSANTNNTLEFEEADKLGGGAALFKTTAPANWVELLISDSATKWDRLLINLDDNAMDVEDNLDGKKLYNPGLDFFTLSKDGERLAVDVRPYNDGAAIPLGLTAYNRYNKYVIKTGMFDIPAGTKLYLHDKWLNRKEELKAGFEYWFDVTADTLSQGNNRFEINMVGQPTNGIAFAEKQSAKMQLMPNPARAEVKISFDKLEGKAQLKLTGVTGKVIFSREIDAATGSVTIPLHNIPAGIYIAELHSTNARFTEKLIVE